MSIVAIQCLRRDSSRRHAATLEIRAPDQAGLRLVEGLGVKEGQCGSLLLLIITFSIILRRAMNRGAFFGLVLLAGCSSAAGIQPPATGDGADPFDIPLETATKEQVALFFKGDALFDVPFREP